MGQNDSRAPDQFSGADAVCVVVYATPLRTATFGNCRAYQAWQSGLSVQAVEHSSGVVRQIGKSPGTFPKSPPLKSTSYQVGKPLMPSSLLVMPSAGVVSVVLPPQDSGSMPPEVDAHTMFMLLEYAVRSWNLCRETDWHVLLVLPCSQVVHCMAWHLGCTNGTFQNSIRPGVPATRL